MYSQWLEDDDEQREPHNKIGIRGWRQYLPLVTDAYNDTQRCSWFSIYMEMTRGSKTVRCRVTRWGILGGGTITVKAHLEYRIGLFSTPLYDFNGKALCEHAPQEMIKLKWMVIGGE